MTQFASSSVRFLETDGANLAYLVGGSGPGVLIPWCNFSWLDLPYPNVLAERFTVVVASPRGFGRSTRPEADDYSTDMLAADLLAVTTAVGLARFSVFGYSLAGAVAAWLAHQSDRVSAIVAGGFPLLGSYRRLLADVEQKVAEGAGDAAARAAINAEFDSRAAVAFYRHLATMPDGALVDRVSCPMYSFWGERDEIIDTLGEGVAELEAGLRSRRVTTHALPGLDHLGALLSPGPALPEIVDWLSAPTRRSS